MTVSATTLRTPATTLYSMPGSGGPGSGSSPVVSKSIVEAGAVPALVAGAIGSGVLAGAALLTGRPDLRNVLTTGAIILGGAALLGGVVWWNNNRSVEYMLQFSKEPDYSNAHTPTEVWNVLQQHWQRYGVPVEAELAKMKDEGLIVDFTGISAANGFVVKLHNGDAGTVQKRLANLPEVGRFDKAGLAG